MLQKVRSLFLPEPAAREAAASSGKPAAAGHEKAMPGVLRHSNGLSEFLKGWDKATGRRVLDLGCTSSFNLCYRRSYQSGEAAPRCPTAPVRS